MKVLIAMIMLSMSAINLIAQDVNTYFHEAQEIAMEEGKSILIVFSGSDWCKPCIQFKKDILEDVGFSSFKKENLVHLELDFPYSKKNKLSKEQLSHNEGLAEKYNPNGVFPMILLTDVNGNPLKVLEYKKGVSPDVFISQIETALSL